MAYDNYEIRKAGINKWFDEYITSTFVSTKQFGHLHEYHINKSDQYLMKCCVKEQIQASTFIGKESDILKMLQKEILIHRDELIEYLADLEDDDVWEIEGKLNRSVTGHVFFLNNPNHEWKNGAIICKDFKISFKKNPKNPNLLVITSAYPF